MIKSIVREHKWHPEIIGKLYIDDQDFNGLDFWYNDIKQEVDALKNKKGD
jgi:hypothetical protein